MWQASKFSLLSLRSLCNLQQASLEIVYFWHSNGNHYLIRDTHKNQTSMQAHGQEEMFTIQMGWSSNPGK